GPLLGLALGAALVLLAVRDRAPAPPVHDAVHDALARLDAKLGEIERERAHARGALDEQLRALAGETRSLAGALRQPHARGRWGELQLRRVVELAGMTAHCDFAEQVTERDGERLLRPDLVVRLPGGRQVVVDAKAPLHAFLDAHEARDEAARTQALAAHARLLRTHVRRLAAKAYWDQFASAPDVVLLFLPGEHFYGAALEADPALLEEGVRQNVLIATPTTLIALLRAVSYGWQQERIAHEARAVAQLGRELQRRLETFAEHLQRVGSRLRGAVGAYNDAVGSFEQRLLPGARRLAEHGVGPAEHEPAAPARIDLAARELTPGVRRGGHGGTPIS
ncbi:MAG TPA: DNA recombination protein RmuC, partial [Conexibacter sp.]|nr:DNA recombination protein RmuC [Conexibacter sp.]